MSSCGAPPEDGSKLFADVELVGSSGTEKTVMSAVLLGRLGKSAAAWHFYRHDDTAQSQPRAVLDSLSAMLGGSVPGFARALEAVGVEATLASGKVDTAFATLIV